MLEGVVSLTIYNRSQNHAGKWRYARVKIGRGIKTGDIPAPFYVRRSLNGKQVWDRLHATTFVEAQSEANQREAGLAAQAEGLVVGGLGRGTTVAGAVEVFLRHAAMSKKPKTVTGYRLNLTQFKDSTKAIFLGEITKDTLRAFRDWMSQQGYDPRTQHNRMLTVLSLLKENKISTGFSLRRDLPTYEENPPVPFNEDELKRMFAAMDEEEIVRYKFFLGTAAREQEVQYASWQDVDLEKMEFHVRAKKDFGFTPKNHERRTVPMPGSLAKLLGKWKTKHGDRRWLFVNKDGKPEGHFLKKFKRIALHAGLNCGQCTTTVNKGRYEDKRAVEVTCATDPVCDHIFLHRLRKTCASRWESAGIPVRTIQYYLGHKSLETTMKYLGVVDSAKLRSHIDKAFGD
jgi:integrase